MTSATRAAIKLAIDRRVRDSVRDRTVAICLGCGGDYSSRTEGCRQCYNRHSGRRKRERAAA